MEYNIRNGSIRLQISIRIKVIFGWFSPFSRYSHFKFRDLENVDQDHDHDG